MVGGGHSAGQATVLLSQTASKVYLLLRSSTLAKRMSRYLIHRIANNPGINLLCDTEIVALAGEEHLEGVSPPLAKISKYYSSARGCNEAVAVARA